MRNKHGKNLKKRYHYDIKNKINKRDLIKKIKIKYVKDIFKICIDDYNGRHYGYLNENCDNETLCRLVLNYIRHNFTNYDKVIKSLTSEDDANGLKELLNRKIIIKYEKEFKEIYECKLKTIMRDCTD